MDRLHALSMLGMVSDQDDGPIGGAEASARPLVNSTNVVSEFRHATILLTVVDSDLWATGIYNASDGNMTCVMVFDPTDHASTDLL